ncbi:hypothetical protein BU16DRAFT_460458 [Lophium mytilinum]|uniref:Uncharacterized protein n=1 Tax=Lophium mytilinum TaxID=390894 RepID=A0A6A6QXT9_9PEZI|nr:hypothetical protein BU16DRAFT_460458 [Lophium mytilinum]
MDPLAVVGSVVQVTEVAFRLIQFITSVAARRPFQLLILYGVSGLFLYLFGSNTTWRVESQVLGQLSGDDGVDDAMNFKTSVLDGCTMISVASALLAQISITALSLDALSQTHWTARGSLIFSLTTALMAVYYATTQHRIMSRLLSAKQVRSWIRGGEIIIRRGRHHLQAMLQARAELRPCDPTELDHVQAQLIHDRPQFLRQTCFTPSVAAVVTISAPQMLLSTSLMALLLGLGIYLGFTWTFRLDTVAGPQNSRNVFITYVVGLTVSIIVYSMSRLIQNKDARSEVDILDSHLSEYVLSHADVVFGWGFMARFDERGDLTFAPRDDNANTETNP